MAPSPSAVRHREAVPLLAALAAGLVFGLGLIASGMTNPAKVLAFLDLAGAWDPSLALVMGGAVMLALLPFGHARRRQRTLDGQAIAWPTGHGIDTRLILGGVLFGMGWGLAGLCPGPAIVALAAGLSDVWIFVVAMLVGFVAHDRLTASQEASETST